MINKLTLILACLMMTGTVWAQQTPPTDGAYYVIKNQSSDTYIGGNGSGDNAVKHEAAGTNDNYHVFKVTGNETDGYVFQQQYSGNNIQHTVGNKWTMAYSATASSRWLLSNRTDYFVINRKEQSDGIGADNASSGQTLYSDKTETATLPNKWLFDAGEAKTILLAQLSAVISAIPSSITTALDGAVNTAKTITGSNTSAEIIAAISAIKKDWAEALLPATGGDYFIKVGGYYINFYDPTANNQVTTVALGALVENINIADANQIFNIAKLSGTDHTTSIDRYAVFSRKNIGWHIADNGRFRSDWGNGDNDWRTVNFLYDGTKYAWQFAGSSANRGFLKMVSGNELKDDSNTTLDANDFIFDIIPVFTVFSEKVTAGRAFYNDNSSNIGTNSGQYTQAVYDAFGAALDVAIATARTFIDGNNDNTWLIDDVNAQIAAVNNALTALESSLKLYYTNKLADGEYFIYVPSDNTYFKNPGATVVPDGNGLRKDNGSIVADRVISDASEIFTLTKVSAVNRYSIYSAVNEKVDDGEDIYRHLTENAVYQSSWGSSDNNWRTMNIYLFY